MNTNRLYVVDVYRITEFSLTEKSISNVGVFSRKTLVYDTSYGDFYDLITEQILDAGIKWHSVGMEYIKETSFIPFNDYINNKRENLSKRKIKKLYIDYTNNGNNK